MPTKQMKSPRKPAQSKRRAKLAERRRQERELDEGLQDTFPASDPVAVNQPAPPDDD